MTTDGGAWCLCTSDGSLMLAVLVVSLGLLGLGFLAGRSW